MFALMEDWTPYCMWYFLPSLQLVSVPEVRCFQTVCPPVPPPVHLPNPLDLLQPLASAGRSVWGAVSVLQVSTSTRVSVWKEMIVHVSIADAPTSQGTGYSRDAILGEGEMCVFVLLSMSPLLYLPFDTYNSVASVCRSGQWQCTGEKCAAQCSLMGALQVTTFDKKRYSLQGGDCPFTAVEVRHIQW